MKGTGLLGQYYSNTEFKGEPSHSRVDEQVLFDFTTGAPFSDMSVNNYSMIWTGRFVPQQSGQYRFVLKSDDGTRLYLDDKMVLDHWGNHAAWEKFCDTTLQAGKEMTVKIEYYEAGGDASVMFGWSILPPQDAKADALLTTEVLDAGGNTVSINKSRITVHDNSEIKEIHRSLIENPHLWDAKRDPYLYKVKVTLTDASGHELDKLEQPLGLRYSQG
jgi:hypothetical protein